MLPEDYVPKTITGFEGAIDSLVKIGQLLERNHKVMFIFLDQFENLFFLLDVLKRIRELFLKIQDAQTNVVLGFSWKTDLVGLTSEFPYQTRDTFANSSKHIILDPFSKEETDALLDKLSKEIRAPLRKDLRFLLSEFSQGYPWLLKKLCAHVKSQRDIGILQADIATSFLNVEELFREDLSGLLTEEEDALRRIAKVAPISIPEIGEDFSPDVIRSRIHRRLVVRIGSKYDIYWDIFRDYLNFGLVPVQDNYILRTQVGSILNETQLLVIANGQLSMSVFMEKSGLSKSSAYNVLRDMRLLGLVKVDGGNVTLVETWETYARTFARWMDRADLAIFDSRAGILFQFTPGTGILDRHPLLARRRRGIIIPSIQYTPIEKVIIRLVDALQKEGGVDIRDIKRSTLNKALSMLEDLGFIERKVGYIRIMPKNV
jgi:predicted transcriptional regulator